APGQAAGPAAACGRPHVVVQGTGPAVLITAGPGGAWFHWDEVAGRLAGAHRVIRFDRPGLGLSPGPPAPPTLYDEVARLAALSPAHPEQVVLIAHGVACWHAEAFARLHPMRLAKLVLVEPACPVTRRPAAFLEAAGTWLPALGGTWGATALARVAGPLTHRLLTGRPDPSGVYGMGKVLAAMAGERLARRGMADGLRRLRAEMPFPEVAVTVLGSGRGDGCARRLAAELSGEPGTEPGAELGTGGVRLLRTRRRPQLNAPEAVAGAV
ncbi:alpha/beta fold hydrolase, partial [Nonomuraea sp. NPDC004297]